MGAKTEKSGKNASEPDLLSIISALGGSENDLDLVDDASAESGFEGGGQTDLSEKDVTAFLKEIGLDKSSKKEPKTAKNEPKTAKNEPKTAKNEQKTAKKRRKMSRKWRKMPKEAIK
eukprot:TRINITY_DN445_c0_g1_i1.p2 TRINITY_DN445_c0_g1~~TRINITY_DN445_c0_g1_i1.p2  ORF type:complete len:117 (-),score=22.86 TRINITY_DN445_c0_g1_i1:157-507(-)